VKKLAFSGAWLWCQGALAVGQDPWALHCVKAGNFLRSAYRLSLTAFWECNNPPITLLVVRWKASQTILSNYDDLLLLSLFCYPYISRLLQVIHIQRLSHDRSLVFTCPTPVPSLIHSTGSGLSFQGNHKFLCHSLRFVI